MSDLLVARGVRKQFGGVAAVDGLDLAVAAGRVTGLIGPNGAGKTTLLRLLAGELAPDTGEVRLAGRPLPTTPEAAARSGVGRLYQEVRVFGDLTPVENVRVAAPGQAGEGVWTALLRPGRVARETALAEATARAALATVGLTERLDAPARSLSYGQQKLVALARLLALGSRVLLLDEPASGVNPRLVEELGELIRRLAAEGRAMVVVEHNLELIRRIADTTVLLDRGRTVVAGPTAEVFASGALAEVYRAAAGG